MIYWLLWITCSCISKVLHVLVFQKLSKHDVNEAFDATIDRSLVESLIYLTTTRSDLMYSVNLLSRFMTSPKRSHWEAGKKVFKYILETTDNGIHYKMNVDNVLVGYNDTDWGGNIDDFESTSGYVFNIGYMEQFHGYKKSRML